MYSIGKCIIFWSSLVRSADRNAFEKCSTSKYCLSRSQTLGRWRWVKSNVVVQTNNRLTLSLYRSCQHEDKPCPTYACDCGVSTTTSAPSSPSEGVMYELDREADVILDRTNYTAPTMHFDISVIAGLSCAIRVQASLIGVDAYVVGPEIFNASQGLCENPSLRLQEQDGSYTFTDGVEKIAQVQLEPFQLSIFHQGIDVVQVKDFVVAQDSHGFRLVFTDPTSQHGLPEHTTSFNLPTRFHRKPHLDSDSFYRFYNADVFEFELDSPMAMYASIPWLTTVHKKALSGVLSVQPSELYIKLDTSDDAAQASSTAVFVGEHSRFDLVFYTCDRAGGLTKLTQQMSFHTGHAPLPPTASLGLHQARWNYITEHDVDYVSSSYTKFQLPLDYIWLDIDHADDRQYFTWNKAKFANPESMRLKLLERKHNLVVIVDPHIKATASYEPYEIFKKQEVLVRNEHNGEYHGWCWPGDSVYPDTIAFHNSTKLTQLYEKNFRNWPELYNLGTETSRSSDNHDIGSQWCSGSSRCLEVADLLRNRSVNVDLWIDMSEPSVFNGAQVTMPKSALHHGGKYRHSEVHNAYGLYFAKIIHEALEKARPEQRSFSLTRSAFVGSQKYGAIWAGDNTASYKYLKNSIPLVLSLALAGFSFSGSDVSGFFGEPDTDLYYKWLSLGIWYPFFRIHSTLGSSYRELYAMEGLKVQTPFVTKEVDFVDAARDLLDLRYSLIPFWALIMYKHSTQAVPIWTSLTDFDLLHQIDQERPLGANDEAFIVGDTFFIHPDLGDESKFQFAPPSGVKWYTWPDLREAGQKTSFGYFIKEESILFTKERPRLNVEAQRFDPYTVTIILPSSQNQPICGHVVLDDLKSRAPSFLVEICVSALADGKSFVLYTTKQAPVGLWSTIIERVRVRIAGIPVANIYLTIDGKKVSHSVKPGEFLIDWDMSGVKREITFAVSV